MEKKEKLREKLYQMVNEFVEVCDLDSEYYLVEKNDYTAKIIKQGVRDMASNIELSKAREEVRIETLKEVEYALEEGIRYKHGIRFTEIQEVLSKLKDNYLTTQEGIEGFISELEKEAERRGLEKALGFIIREGNINWAKDKIVESIKLLKDNK